MINRIYEGSSITTMDNTCVICTEEIGKDRATTECGHTFHTRCFANNIALNVGSEAGTTRHLCVLCRDSVCEPVQTSKNITIRLDDLTEEVSKITEANEGWVIYCREIEKRNSALRHTLSHSQLAETLLFKRFQNLQENYRKQKFISDRRAEVIAKLQKIPISFMVAISAIQKWFRNYTIKRDIIVKKHRDAWGIYKQKISSSGTQYETTDGLPYVHRALTDYRDGPCRSLSELFLAMPIEEPGEEEEADDLEEIQEVIYKQYDDYSITFSGSDEFIIDLDSSDELVNIINTVHSIHSNYTMLL